MTPVFGWVGAGVLVDFFTTAGRKVTVGMTGVAVAGTFQGEVAGARPRL